MSKHQDSKDIDFQCAMVCGKFTGGELWCYSEDEKMWLKVKIPKNPIIFDGRIPHLVTLVESGTRFHFIIYRHLQSNFPGQHPVYDLARLHPDSEPIGTLDKDGYSVHQLKGLEEVYEMVQDYLFEMKGTNYGLKKSGCDALKLNWLYMEDGKKIGLDNNRYVLQRHMSHELVAAVTVAMGSVFKEIGAKTVPELHDFGFMLRTQGCRKQPDHIDGEKDNYFTVIPIFLTHGQKYKLYALKVSKCCSY